jgi:hypothetical protein
MYYRWIDGCACSGSICILACSTRTKCCSGAVRSICLLHDHSYVAEMLTSRTRTELGLLKLNLGAMGPMSPSLNSQVKALTDQIKPGYAYPTCRWYSPSLSRAAHTGPRPLIKQVGPKVRFFWSSETRTTPSIPSRPVKPTAPSPTRQSPFRLRLLPTALLSCLPYPRAPPGDRSRAAAAAPRASHGGDRRSSRRWRTARGCAAALRRAGGRGGG